MRRGNACGHPDVRRAIFRALRAVSALDHRLRERLTPAGWLVLGTAGAAAAAGLDTNQTVTYRAFTFLFALLVLAYLASQFFRARLESSRDLPRYATAGEPCTYRVVVANRGTRALEGATVFERFRDPRPAYEEWRRAREPGEERRNWWDRTVGYFRWRWLIERRLPRDVERAELGALAPGEQRELRLAFTPRRRGRIEFAGLTIGRPDPLGLVRGLVRLPLAARLIALPRRYRLPQIALPGRRKFQPGGVSLAASVGDSEEFLALRDYRPGDPLAARALEELRAHRQAGGEGVPGRILRAPCAGSGHRVPARRGRRLRGRGRARRLVRLYPGHARVPA